jgi:hypothetical protein
MAEFNPGVEISTLPQGRAEIIMSYSNMRGSDYLLK